MTLFNLTVQIKIAAIGYYESRTPKLQLTHLPQTGLLSDMQVNIDVPVNVADASRNALDKLLNTVIATVEACKRHMKLHLLCTVDVNEHAGIMHDSWQRAVEAEELELRRIVPDKAAADRIRTLLPALYVGENEVNVEA